MTNHWIDIKNADCILIIGSNAAENHPISFKYVLAAQDKGAKVIHVDPRYSRTSSKADMYIRIRSGTDIAFMGGMIYYILEDMRLHPENYNLDYVQQYTNAAYIVNDKVKLPGEAGQDGLFNGWNGKSYDKDSWVYADWLYGSAASKAKADSKLLSSGWADWTSRTADEQTAWGQLEPNSVLRLLWRQYSRYTKEKVSRITGIPVDKLDGVYKEYAKTGARGKAGTIMYAMGATQHTYGSQNIRTYSIIQLLLGNMGVAGGGINALRGTSNVQGSTDFALLEQYLPGYLKIPTDADTDRALGTATTVDTYLYRATPGAINPPTSPNFGGTAPVNWWGNTPKYIHSLLKAWWPTQSNRETAYGYLPKKKASGVNYTHVGLIEAIGRGDIEGLCVWGQNPAAGGPDSAGAREALGKLKWMMASDIWFNETHTFWKRPDINPEDIQTEVFLLPAAASFEKQGSVSNSGRWVQWRYRAVEPPEDALPDLDIMSRLFQRIQDLYEADEAAPNREAITKLSWPYSKNSKGEVDPDKEVDPDDVAKEINGYALEPFETTVGMPAGQKRTYAKDELIDWFGHLQTDGKTSSGNWLFCGQYTTAKQADEDNPRVSGLITSVNGFRAMNRAKRRDNLDTSLVGATGETAGLYSNWSWCWPFNRRIIYNRAAVDLNGEPWDAEHPVLKWNGTAWVGDIVDGGGNPINLAAPAARNLPFIMNAEGVGKLWGYLNTYGGLKDGPIPEVYEPWESPLDKNLINDVANDNSKPFTPGFNDPTAYYGNLVIDGKNWNERGTADEGFKYVATTYRCTEHWQTGIMTRNLPWLAELMPDMYVELGEDLAGELEIASGDKVKVSSKRGSIEALAIVTKRFQAITVGDGQVIHHVGIPWHWGYAGRVTGDSGNILTPHVGDANTSIPEYKTFLCKVEKE